MQTSVYFSYLTAIFSFHFYLSFLSLKMRLSMSLFSLSSKEKLKFFTKTASPYFFSDLSPQICLSSKLFVLSCYSEISDFIPILGF